MKNPVIFASAVPEGRPVRLTAATRAFAFDALNGVYGKAIKSTPFLSMEDVEDFNALSPHKKYFLSIRRIAEQAPLRFCPGEMLCGSATLSDSISHVVPVRYQGKNPLPSMSHLTCGFDRVLREGVDQYEARILKRLPTANPKEKETLAGFLNVVASLRVWHGRYLSALSQRLFEAPQEEKEYWCGLYETLCRVPFSSPRNFREALQSVWFTFAFIRLCGNWPGIGRLDEMLSPYLEADLAKGVLTEDQARELLAHFFIKGCEWITHEPTENGGDAQHYQNIVLGGIDVQGKEVSSTVTRLILEVVEELPISDFPIAVRIGESNPDWLLPLTARVMRHGSGVVAVYNEKLILQSLLDFGYSLEEARRFANDGCWEVQVPGKTNFSYLPMDLLLPFQREVLGLEQEKPNHYDDMEQLYQAVHGLLGRLLEEFHRFADGILSDDPHGVVSVFEDDCIENAKEYRQGGARYNVLSPHFGGVPDVVNSLYAIQKLVFEEKKVSYDELMKILQNNWEGAEPLRQYVRNSYVYYGNDNDEVDQIMVRVMDDYLSQCRKVKVRNGILRPPGISTFGRQIEWKDMRTASAHGFRKGDILSGNLSPTPGTDAAGATAIIRSHCKSRLDDLTCGTALDIKLDPSAAKGLEGQAAIEGLIRGFVMLGGFFMQVDVQDNSVLLDAQKHPEKYPTLAVRISGWSARFVTLDARWQQMVIERSAQAR